jgi:ribosomal protein S18 acetylase RimI-like enzyme
MLTGTITYKIKTAGFDSVFTHLVKCNDNFIPRLSQKIDIPAYSKKIVQNSITFEAWKNDELVGLVAAYFNDKKTSCGFITNVSTVKEYSGKGVASQLMKMCISYAAENRFTQIALEVFHQNNGAIQLYKKYNFIQAGTKGDLIIMKTDVLIK